MAEIAYLGQIFFTLVQLSNIILIFTKSRVSRKRIDDIFDVSPSIIYDENGLVKSINKGDVIYHLDNISIRYEESGNYALSDISLDIKNCPYELYALPYNGSLYIGYPICDK